MKSKMVKLIFLVITIILVIVIKQSLKNDDESFQSLKNPINVPKQEKDEIPIKTYSQDPTTQKIVEWLSNPSVDEGNVKLQMEKEFPKFTIE